MAKNMVIPSPGGSLFVSFPLTCRFRDLQSPVNIHHMKAIWFGYRSRASDSSHKTPLLLLLPAYSLRYLFPRADPQNHHPSCGVETSGLWDTRWALYLAQSTRFRVNIKLDRKEWKVTAPSYCYGSPHTQLHLADSPWNAFSASVTLLTQCWAGARSVHSEVGAASSFLLLLKLFSLTEMVKCTQRQREHIKHLVSTAFIPLDLSVHPK